MTEATQRLFFALWPDPSTSDALTMLAPADQMVLVGWISRPHGLKGDVVVSPETDFPEERFIKGATLWTRSDTCRLVASLPIKSSNIVEVASLSESVHLQSS